MVVQIRPFWVRFPSTVVRFEKAVVHPSVLRETTELGLSVKLGQYLAHVHGKGSVGEDNPYPSAAHGSGLMQPKAIFQGLQRAVGEAPFGDGFFIYVTNPVKDFKLDLDFFSANHQKPEPQRLKLINLLAPDFSVFTVFLSMNTATIDEIRQFVNDPLTEVRIVVTGWEWTLGMPDDSGLPFDHPTRYKSKII